MSLCDPMDCSPPGSSVHGILQARILEWVAISFSKYLWARYYYYFHFMEGRNWGMETLYKLPKVTELLSTSQNSSWGRLTPEPRLLTTPLPCLSSVQFSSVDSLRPHGLQHTRLPCPSPTPRVYSNSCASPWWCRLTISSSVVPFSSCLQSFPASVSFPISQFFVSGGQSIVGHGDSKGECGVWGGWSGGQIGANPCEECVGLRKEVIFILDRRGTPELFWAEEWHDLVYIFTRSLWLLVEDRL